MRALVVMTLSDLRQRVRDRSVLLFALVVPAALILAFRLVFGGAEDVELQPVTVLASVPGDDPAAAAVTDALAGLRVGDLRVTLRQAPAGEVSDRVGAGEADLGLTVPDGFGAALRAGRPESVSVVLGDGHDLEGQIVVSVVDGVLRRLGAGSVAATAAARSGLPPRALGQVARDAATGGPVPRLVQGRTAPEQLPAGAALVAGQAGFFLLFTAGYGVLGLLAERETGTLARLRSAPVSPWLLVAAKGLVSFLLGLAATAILLTGGALVFGVDFGSPPAVALLVVCVSAAATSLMFVIARLARTREQAGIAQSVVALVLGISGGAFFPVAVSTAWSRLLDLNPVAAFTRGLGITAGGGGLSEIAGPVAIMLVFAAVMLAVSRAVPDRGELR